MYYFYYLIYCNPQSHESSYLTMYICFYIVEVRPIWSLPILDALLLAKIDSFMVAIQLACNFEDGNLRITT